MADQSLLAKLGLRLGVLGSAASLAFAAPLATGDYSVAAATSASRIGWYFDRTAAAEKIGFVIMGTEWVTIGALGIAVNKVPVSGDGMLQIALGSTKANSISWDASTNLYPTASGVLKSDATLNGLMAANSFKANITGAPATSTDITVAQLNTFLPEFVASGASHAGGSVTDPPAGAGTTKFLREDATWAVPTLLSPLVTETATAVTITDATQTSMFGSYSVPGGTLRNPGDKLRLLIEGTCINNSGGSANYTFRVKIGGVTVYNDTGQNILTSANTRSFYLELYITYITATTANVVMRVTVGNSTNPTTGISALAPSNTIQGNTVMAVNAAWTWANATSLDVTFQNNISTSQTVTIRSSQLTKQQ